MATTHYRVKVDEIDLPILGDDDTTAKIWARKILLRYKAKLSPDANVYLYNSDGAVVGGFPITVAEFL